MKVVFNTNKEGGNNNNIFGKLFRTTVVSMKLKSYNQLNFLNLVTMETTNVIQKPFVMLIKHVVKTLYVFGKLFRTTMVSMATTS